MTIDQIVNSEDGSAQLIEQLQQELREKTYKAQAIRCTYIDKQGGGQRPLGIPTVRDRVVQMAAYLILEPIFEADFEDCSYGFRRGKNAHQALDKIREHIEDGYTEVYVSLRIMIRVACHNCQTKYKFDEAQLGGKSRVQAKCKKCGATIDIGVAEVTAASAPAPGSPGSSDETSQDTTARVKRLRSDEAAGEATITGPAAAEVMGLPEDKKYSLAVLQGKASGQIFKINKVRTIIGRADCDVILDDPEASRQHASLEILGSRVVVSDLKSTNGTFVDGQQIDATELENHNEFRIGEHVMMLIVTDRE